MYRVLLKSMNGVLRVIYATHGGAAAKSGIVKQTANPDSRAT